MSLVLVLMKHMLIVVCLRQQNSIQRINEDARKNTRHMDKMLNACSKILNHTVFVSTIGCKTTVNLGWQCDSTSVIYNGIDLDILSQEKRLIMERLTLSLTIGLTML